PVVAPAGTEVLICVLDTTLKVAGVSLKRTLVAPVKSEPVMVTAAPTRPLVGENEEIVGAGGMTVKSPALVAVPPGVATLILPVVAPAGTEVLICVLDTTLKVAAVPLKRTLVVPVKSEPVRVTAAPTRPLVGENEEIVGAGGMTVKSPALVAVPPNVATLILPVVAPAGTVVLICVRDRTLKVAAVPLKRTLVVPVKSDPVMVTAAPTRPLVGENEEIVGAGGMTVKSPALVAVPPGVVTLILPVVAPAGTVVLICVLDTTLKVAAVPLKLTLVVPVKADPVMVTTAPTRPLVGENEEIVGAGGMTVKSPALVAVPPGVVTLILPVVAPAGTVVLICVLDTTLKVAAVPLKLTLVVPVKADPVMVTTAPTRPLVGENEEIVGAGGMT